MTITISTTYTLTKRLDDTYYFDDKMNCFNVKKGIKLKQILNNNCVGYCINRKFIALNSMELIDVEEDVTCPF